MSLAFRVGEVELEGKKLHCGVLELENAVVALFWEGEEPKLGSTTATLPGMASSQLLGDRDQLLGRMLGAQVAAKSGKLSLVSTHLSQGYSEAIGKTLLELVRRVMEEKS
ncbi:TPA: hypothetical protein HA344_08905 [Candidatus Bathyarchaeota archaeon]|nr:hypothetical protein [Candidatus Bathyarchaeota archaeon]